LSKCPILSIPSILSDLCVCRLIDLSIRPPIHLAYLCYQIIYLLFSYLPDLADLSFLSYLSYLSKLSHLFKLPNLANLSNLPNLATNIASPANLANLPIPIYLSSLFWPILVCLLYPHSILFYSVLFYFSFYFYFFGVYFYSFPRPFPILSLPISILPFFLFYLICLFLFYPSNLSNLPVLIYRIYLV
jgi:hypothetical protein